MMHAAEPIALRHVVVVGAGGNIGSHLVPHIARMREVGRLTLIDHDVYEERNLQNQSIAGWAVDQNKADVQAQLVHSINPSLEVIACAERVEDVPLGFLRAGLILSCLDSRRARQYVNEAAWHLGVPWLDAGVLADGLVARLDLFVPAPDAPCLECGWDARDYAALEQTYPCDGQQPSAPPTAAPSALGALAAALQALECARLLTGQTPAGSLAAGEQVVLAAAHHRHFRTSHRRNPQCRLGAHDVWAITPLDLQSGANTLGALLDLVTKRFGSHHDLTLSVEGKRFVRELTCHRCGVSRATLCLSSTAVARNTLCGNCNDAMVVTGFGMTDRLEVPALTAADRQSALCALGIRAHDVITIATGSARFHLELLFAESLQATRTEPDPIGVAS